MALEKMFNIILGCFSNNFLFDNKAKQNWLILKFKK